MADGKRLASAVCHNEHCSLHGYMDKTWIWVEHGLAEYLHDEDEPCPECGEPREILW